MKKIFLLSLLLSFCFNVFSAQFGYFIDKNTAEIKGKFIQITDESPLMDNCDIRYCKKSYFETVEVKDNGKTSEDLIREKIKTNQREKAINDLKSTGKLPKNFKDLKVK